MDTSLAIKLFLWKRVHEILPTMLRLPTFFVILILYASFAILGKKHLPIFLWTPPLLFFVWQRLFGNNNTGIETTINLLQWFNSWFSVNSDKNHQIITYTCACWFIWKTRCDHIFREIVLDANLTGKSIKHICITKLTIIGDTSSTFFITKEMMEPKMSSLPLMSFMLL